MITPEIARYLTDIHIPLRLACVTTAGWPLVLSLWFLYEDGHLYCATPETATTVALLRAEPRCGFEVAADTPPYCGVRGRAEATILPERGDEVLGRLLRRYLGGLDSPLARRLRERETPEVALQLRPVSVTTWDFRGRMRDSVGESAPAAEVKLCP